MIEIIQSKSSGTGVVGRRRSLWLFIFCSAVLLLTACEKIPIIGSGFKENQVLRVGDQYATREQACVLMCGLQKKYENMFGSEAWTKDFGDSTLEQYVQEQVKTQLVQLLSMDFMAQERNLELDADEKERVRQAAGQFIQLFSKEQLKAAGFKKEDVQELYECYALADKLYSLVTDEVNKEISDDQARRIDVQVIFFAAGENGELSQEERNALNERAYQVWERANAGESFEALASQFNEGDKFEYHIGRGEMEAGFEEAAFHLVNGQISSLVEGENGLYIIKCISNYNQTETDANKTAIYEEECARVFNKEYDKFMKDVEVELNEEAWAKVAAAGTELPETDFVQIYKETE